MRNLTYADVPSGSPRTTEQPAYHVIKLNPVVYWLHAAPIFAHTDFHQSLATIRKLAPRDPQRAPQRDEAIKRYRERLPQEWQRRSRDFSFLGKNPSKGKLQPFFRFLRDCGPRGLALMLADEKILEHIESWWVESILGNALLRKNLIKIGKELARAGSRGRKQTRLPDDKAVDKAIVRIRKAAQRHQKNGLPDHKKAWEQAIADFCNRSRISLQRKKLVREALRSLPEAKGVKIPC